MANISTAISTLKLDTHKKLNSLLDINASALPSDFNRHRFVQNCMEILPEIYEVESIDPSSIARTLLKGAFLGLDFFNKECYAIPYSRKEGAGWKKDLRFQTDYRGERKLAKKYSIRPIKDIYAKIVRDGDDFEEQVVDGLPSISFKPKPFSDEKIIGAFAVVLYQDGTMNYEVMTTNEIESLKNAYAKKDQKGQFSKAWNDSFGEMAKKTVSRRLCKSIELEFEKSEQRKTWEESSEFEFKQQNVIPITATSSLDGLKALQDKGAVNEPVEANAE